MPQHSQGLCLPAQSCQGKSLLAPSPGALEGSSLPSPSGKAAHEDGARARAAPIFLCSPRLSLGAENQPQGKQPPKNKGDREVPAPHRPGTLTGALHPPRGDQGSKRSVMG